MLCKIGTVALLVERDRFAALLDHRLQHALDFGFGQALGIALPALGDIPLLETREDQSNGRHRPQIPGLHCFLQPVPEGLTQHGGLPPFPEFPA